MNSSFWIDAITWNGPLYNSKGYRLQFLYEIAVFSSDRSFLVQANSADLDEMPYYVTFNLGLLCLQL